MFLFDTIAEYDEEIAFVRAEIRNAVKSKKFRLNTSQSDQTVEMDLPAIQKYLVLLTTQKTALAQRLLGMGVTSIISRRCI